MVWPNMMTVETHRQEMQREAEHQRLVKEALAAKKAQPSANWQNLKQRMFTIQLWRKRERTVVSRPITCVEVNG